VACPDFSTLETPAEPSMRAARRYWIAAREHCRSDFLVGLTALSVDASDPEAIPLRNRDQAKPTAMAR
jgi:hypothetical protein